MITLSKLSNFTDEEVKKLGQGISLVNYALKDPIFISRLKALKYDFTNDTNDEILANISKDGTISSLDIKMLSWWSNHILHTIAYEVENKIVFNRYYFDKETVPAISNTVFHEWTHACGYRHSSSTDYASVPYQSGDELEKYLLEMDTEKFNAYLWSAVNQHIIDLKALKAASSPAQPASETATTS